MERAKVRRIKSSLYIFPHPTFSLWRRLKSDFNFSTLNDDITIKFNS
jgi:hypothetical protein